MHAAFGQLSGQGQLSGLFILHLSKHPLFSV